MLGIHFLCSNAFHLLHKVLLHNNNEEMKDRLSFRILLALFIPCKGQVENKDSEFAALV